MQTDNSDLERRFTEELEALEGRPLTLRTDAVRAWVLISHLQFALRDPRNTGPTAEIAREIAQNLIDVVAPPGTALREVAEKGWRKAGGS